MCIRDRFLSLSGSSVYAAIELRICKNDNKRIVIETYGEVAKTVTGGMSLWFNKGNDTTPDWVKLNSTSSGVIMPYATTSYTFKESKRNGSTTIDCCKKCPSCGCKTCSLSPTLSAIVSTTCWYSGGPRMRCYGFFGDWHEPTYLGNNLYSFGNGFSTTIYVTVERSNGTESYSFSVNWKESGGSIHVEVLAMWDNPGQSSNYPNQNYAEFGAIWPSDGAASKGGTVIFNSYTIVNGYSPSYILPYGYNGVGDETAYFSGIGIYIAFKYTCNSIQLWSHGISDDPYKTTVIYYTDQDGVQHELEALSLIHI